MIVVIEYILLRTMTSNDAEYSGVHTLCVCAYVMHVIVNDGKNQMCVSVCVCVMHVIVNNGKNQMCVSVCVCVCVCRMF